MTRIASAKRVISRWLKNTVLGAMHQWYQWTKYKKEKETNELVEQEKIVTNEKRKKHLKILVGRTLAFRNTSISTACFQWWTAWTILHKKRCQKRFQHIQKIHRRRFIRVMSATFRCWRKESDNTNHFKKIVKKIMQQWIRKAQHQQFARSFYKWSDTTRKDAQRKINELKAQQASAKATAIVAAKVATKVAATLKQHVEDERKKQLFHKIIKHFFRQTKTKAFRSWSNTFKQSKLRFEIGKKFMNRMLRRWLYKSFQAWRVFADDILDAKYVFYRFILRISSNQYLFLITKGWYKWRELIMYNNNESQAAALKRRETVLRTRVARSFMNHSLRLAFQGWSYNAAQLRRHRNIVKRALIHIGRRTVVTAFRSWSNTFKQSKLRFEIGKKFMNRMLRRWLYKSFQAWRVFADDILDAKYVFYRFILRISSNQYLFLITKGWYKWRELIMYNNNESQAAALKRRETVLRTRVARSFMNHSLRLAFQGWSYNAAQLRHHRNIVKGIVMRVAARLASKELYRGMRKWCVWLSLARLEEERERILLHRVHSIMSKRYIYQSFRGW